MAGAFLILIAVVAIVVLAGLGVLLSLRSRTTSAPGPVRQVQDPPRKPVAEVLRQRLDEGDITPEEYQQRLREASPEGRN